MNPLGVRALYLGSSMYRIHGTDAPWTIGTSASAGCIRLYNEDVLDLYPRVKIGTKVTVTYQTFTKSGAVSAVAAPSMGFSSLFGGGDDETPKAQAKRPPSRAKAKGDKSASKARPTATKTEAHADVSNTGVPATTTAAVTQSAHE
jgi:hypothetical protein